jgi:hypothetical protein
MTSIVEEEKLVVGTCFPPCNGPCPQGHCPSSLWKEWVESEIFPSGYGPDGRQGLISFVAQPFNPGDYQEWGIYYPGLNKLVVYTSYCPQILDGWIAILEYAKQKANSTSLIQNICQRIQNYFLDSPQIWNEFSRNAVEAFLAMEALSK